jgi:hypothetical protein
VRHDVPVYWLTLLSGKLGAQIGVQEHASLAAKDAYNKKLSADPRWQKISKDAGPRPYWAQRGDCYYVVA